jgi:hypothetical protein
MDTVIIPHPTEMLILIREQKKLVYELNSAAWNGNNTGSCIVFPHYPLWCTHINEEPKKLGPELSSFTICAPVIKGNNIMFPCRVTTKNSRNLSNCIIYAALFNEKTNPLSFIPGQVPFIKKTIERHASFSLPCRIFQIAVTEIKDTGWQVTESIWIKTSQATTPPHE